MPPPFTDRCGASVHERPGSRELNIYGHPRSPWWPSRSDNPLGLHIGAFEACSAFTHVPAYVLARTPKVTLSEWRRSLRYLHNRSGGYRLERPVVGWELHPQRIDALARRTIELGSWVDRWRDEPGPETLVGAVRKAWMDYAAGAGMFEIPRGEGRLAGVTPLRKQEDDPPE